MTPHPSRLHWPGRLGLTGVVLLISAWGGGFFIHVAYCHPKVFAALDPGALTIAWAPDFVIRDAHEWTVERARFTGGLSVWQPRFYRIRKTLLLHLPLWIPIILLGSGTFLVWRRSGRVRCGHCQVCGYDLTGNISGVCSECGAEVSSHRSIPLNREPSE